MTKASLARIILIFSLLLPFPAQSAEVTAETQTAWEKSVHSLRERLAYDHGALLRDDSPGQLKRVGHYGEEPIVNGEIETVPSGLIHHWVGTTLIRNAQVPDLLSVLQDYEDYNKVYAPAVVESRLGTHTADEFNYRLRFVQKGLGVRVGLIAEFRTMYHETDRERGYSVTESTKLHEVQSPGGQDEKIVESARSLGYVQRTFAIVRYEQSAEGTIVQVETLTLSRGVNASVRWIVLPVIRRFSQQTMLLTLQRLQSSVQATGERTFASTR